MDNTFDYLISPLSRERFFSEFFEKKHIHLTNKDKNRFDHVLTEQLVEEVISTQKLTLPNTRMAHNDTDFDANELTIEGSNIIDITKVVEKYSEGATLILSQLQDRVDSLKQLCNSLTKDFGQRFQTNVYCTPRNESQGFSTHHDTHDVYIIQVEGSKKWSIYESPIALAIKDQQYDKDEHIPGKVTDEFIMNPGDVLYIPRGLMHSAKTTDQKSIHITIGCMGYTWQDLLIGQINRLSQSNINLRTGFAPNFWNEPEKCIEKYKEILSALDNEEEMNYGLNLLYQNSVNKYRINVETPLKQAEEIGKIDLSTKVILKDTTHYFIKQSNEAEFSITLYNKEITLPMEYYSIVEFITSNKLFTIEELPLLDSKGKIELGRLLLKSCFLNIVV